MTERDCQQKTCPARHRARSRVMKQGGRFREMAGPGAGRPAGGEWRAGFLTGAAPVGSIGSGLIGRCYGKSNPEKVLQPDEACCWSHGGEALWMYRYSR